MIIKKYKMFLEKKGTPDLVDDIVNNIVLNLNKHIKDEYLNLNIDENKKDYNLKADIIINLIKGENYKGNFNYKKSLDSNFKGCIINIEYPDNFDINKITKTLTHELTHLYELYQIKDIFNKTRWKWQEALDNTKKQNKVSSNIHYFRDILYLSLPQEINSRVSSLYRYLLGKSKMNYTKEEIIEILKETKEWQNYLNLVEFSPSVLINSLNNTFSDDYNFLFFIFNELNLNLGISFKIKNIDDLEKYLNKTNKMIKGQADKYKKKIFKVVDRVYEELNESIEYITNDPFDVKYNNYLIDNIKLDRNSKINSIIELDKCIKKYYDN